MRFKKARRLIEGVGWKLDRVRGSHYIFTKDGEEFILPQHSKDLPLFLRRKITKELLKVQVQECTDEQRNFNVEDQVEEFHPGY